MLAITLKKIFQITQAFSLKCLLFLAIGFFMATQVQAQVSMTGSVKDKTDNTPIPFVTVISTRTGTTVSSDSLGNFKLLVENQDTLILRRVGFQTAKVSFDYKLTNGKETFFLDKAVQQLKNVSVTAGRDFKKDSLQFRQENSGLFDKKKAPSKPSINKQASDNYGQILLTAKISPSSLYNRYLNGQEKRERHFRKVLESEEKEHFIDSKYTPKLVRTVLNNDTLDVDDFMLKFRPTFDFVKSASEYDMDEYVIDSYAAYMKEQQQGQKK